MGTVIYYKNGLTVKRYYGGEDKGTYYAFFAGAGVFTQEELRELTQTLSKELMPSLLRDVPSQTLLEIVLERLKDQSKEALKPLKGG